MFRFVTKQIHSKWNRNRKADFNLIQPKVTWRIFPELSYFSAELRTSNITTEIPSNSYNFSFESEISFTAIFKAFRFVPSQKKKRRKSFPRNWETHSYIHTLTDAASEILSGSIRAIVIFSHSFFLCNIKIAHDYKRIIIFVTSQRLLVKIFLLH